MRRMMALLMSCALAVGLMVIPAEAYDMGKAGEYQTVSLGGTHTAAIKTDGSLWAWGRNDSGQVGNGGAANAAGPNGIPYQSTPVKVLDSVVSVSCGVYHTAAIKADGSLWVWGSNEYGQVGNSGGGSASNNGKPIQTTPVKVLDNVAAVACGDNSTAAIKTDGTLWIWGGRNGSTPAKIMDGIAAVSCDSLYSVIKEDGTLWVWGSIYKDFIYKGQATGGYVASYVEYTNPIKLASDVASISCNGDGIAYVKSDGTVWTWSSNTYGQRGDGTISGGPPLMNTPPTQVQGLSNAVSVNCGKSFCHVAVVLADGSLWMWGSNHYGQLGNGLTGNAQENTNSYHPIQTVPVKIMDQVTSAVCGSNNTAVIKNDGTLWTWGDNSWDTLGYHEGDKWYTIGMAAGGPGGSSQGSVRWSAQTTPKQVTDFAVKPSGGTAPSQPVAPVSPGVAGFTDVAAADYFAEPVKWALSNGITNGTSDTAFSPDEECTHVQILMFLYRAVKRVDAPSSDDMEKAVTWAHMEKDMTEVPFQSNKPCTRAEAVNYIWQAMGKSDAPASGFTDVDADAPYAKAVDWAVANGITSGTDTVKNTFSPNDICTRGQIVTFLHRAYVPSARLTAR